MYAIRSYYDRHSRHPRAQLNGNGRFVMAAESTKKWLARITSYNVCYTKLLRRLQFPSSSRLPPGKYRRPLPRRAQPMQHEDKEQRRKNKDNETRSCDSRLDYGAILFHVHSAHCIISGYHFNNLAIDPAFRRIEDKCLCRLYCNNARVFPWGIRENGLA